MNRISYFIKAWLRRGDIKAISIFAKDMVNTAIFEQNRKINMVELGRLPLETIIPDVNLAEIAGDAATLHYLIKRKATK